MLAFLDDRTDAGRPVSLHQVFTHFTLPPLQWTGARFARTVSGLFSERLICCCSPDSDSVPLTSGVFLETPDQWDRIRVLPRKRLPPDEMAEVAADCRRIFGDDCPGDPDDLVRHLDRLLKQWKTLLAGFGKQAAAGKYPGSADICACIAYIQDWQGLPGPYEKIRSLRDGRQALRSFFDLFSRIRDFYENRRLQWESWQQLYEKYLEFHEQLGAGSRTAGDLSRLSRIMEMQSPWESPDAAEDLTARIKPVYIRIRDAHYAAVQQEILLEINRMIETISDLLNSTHARDEIRNMALVELQTIKKAIEIDPPGSQLSRQREIAEEAFEKAQDIVLSSP